MKKNVLVFGLIAGGIVSVLMFTGMIIFNFCGSGNMTGGMLFGYASMLLAFSFVYVGVKNQRDKFNDGIITFGKAFMTGLWIMLIASTMYVITWLIEYYFFMPDFMDKYAVMAIDQLKASGAGEAEIQAQMAEMGSMKEMYKNPVWVILFTYMEIIPVGLLFTVVNALILKRKNKQATT